MQNRYHRALRTTANLTLTTDDLTDALEVEYDMDEVTNYATGSTGRSSLARALQRTARH
jgi:hypothetical protein